MTDDDIRKMIIYAVERLPVPWERLWVVFQKILQKTQAEKKSGKKEISE